MKNIRSRNYENKYTLRDQAYRHVASGQIVDRGALRAHSKRWELKTVAQVKLRVKARICGSFLTLPNKYPLGTNELQSYYAARKV